MTLTLTPLQTVMACLDGFLTGKDARKCSHTASQQPATVEAWALRPEWYLSDGGYSRIWLGEDGHIFVTSNSTDLVKKNWERAADYIDQIERMTGWRR